MSKDYANKPLKNSAHDDGRQGLLRLKGRYFLALVLMFLLGFFVSKQDLSSVQKQLNAYLSKEKATIGNKTAKEQKKKSVVKIKPKFEFYHVLENGKRQRITKKKYNENISTARPSINEPDHVLVSDAKPVSLPPSKMSLGADRYILQVGSFKNSADADKLKASLVLKGYDVIVSTFKTQNQIWYRVKLGPFKSLAQAKAIRIDLEHENVSGMLKRIG